MNNIVKVAVALAMVLVISGCVVASSDESHAVEGTPITTDFLADKANENGQYVIPAGQYHLADDLNVDRPLVFQGESRLDLNGNVLTSSNIDAIIVDPTGNLVIDDSGTNGGVTSTYQAASSSEYSRAIYNHGSVNIVGGTYNADRTVMNAADDLAENCHIVIEGGTYNAQQCVRVNAGSATILNGDFNGESFAVVVSADGTVEITNGTFDAATAVQNQIGGNLTISGGTFIGTNNVIAMITEPGMGYTETVIHGGNFNGESNGILVMGGDTFSDSAYLEFNDGTVRTVNGFGICGNGDADNADITVNGGDIRSTNGQALFLPQIGNVTINDGYFEGNGGIQFCGSGTLTVNGGTIVGTSDREDVPYKPDSQGDGSFEDGSALSIVSRGNGYNDADYNMDVVINGGVFTSQHGSPVMSYRAEHQGENLPWVYNTDTSIESFIGGVSIRGGTFDSGVGETTIVFDTTKESQSYIITGGTFPDGVEETFIMDGYILQDGRVVLEDQSSLVAEIEGGTQYASLQDALDNAPVHGTVKLLADAEGNFTVDRTGAWMTLDLNGRSIRGAAGGAALTINNCNELRIEDSSGDHSGSIVAAEGQYCIGGSAEAVTFLGGTFYGDLDFVPGSGSVPEVQDGRFTVDPNDCNVVGNYVYILDEGLGLYVKVDSVYVHFNIVDTVTHDYDSDVKVPMGSVIDPALIPELPDDGEGYRYYWMMNGGGEWDPTQPITESTTFTALREYSFTIVADPAQPDVGETVTLSVSGVTMTDDVRYDFTWLTYDGTDYIEYDTGDTGSTTITQPGTYYVDLTVRFLEDAQSLGGGYATIEVTYPRPNTITYMHDGELYTQRTAYTGDTITADMLPPLPTAPDHYAYVWVDSDLNYAEGQTVTGDMTFQAFLYIEDVSANVWTEYEDGTVYLRSEPVCPVDFTVTNVEWRISGGTVVPGYDVAMVDSAEDYRLYMDVEDADGVPGFAIWVGESMTPDRYRPSMDEDGNYQTDTNTAIISPEDFIDVPGTLQISIETTVVIGDSTGTTSGVQTTISINGTVEDTGSDIVIESKPVSGTVPSNVPDSFTVAVDVTVGNVVDYEMTISVPVQVEEEVLGALAYYYNESTGFLEQVRCAWNAITGMVDIFTDHNTDYYVYLLTESSPTAPEIPQPSDPEPENPPVNPGWNPGHDDDTWIPPTVVVEESDSSGDNTTEIVACAAAAVVAALMAAFLIIERRR